jgi:hypothetical protein
MIPFLKTKNNADVGIPIKADIIHVDNHDEYNLLDAVVEDIFEAFLKKDKRMLKMALEALIDHIKEEDEIQDAHEEEFEE